MWRSDRTIWIAGGVGITPFLSATHGLPPAPAGERPVLFYAVRSVDDAMALDVLRAADADGRIDLVLCSSSLGTRFSRELLAQHARLADAGPAPVYIDCHMGPSSREGYAEACRATGLPFLYPMIDASLRFDSIEM